MQISDFGRNNDGGILRESKFGKLLDNNKLLLLPPRKIHKDVKNKFPFVFFADEAYPLKKNLMKPFARKQQFRKEIITIVINDGEDQQNVVSVF